MPEESFTAGDRKNLEYLIDKGFCIRENGRPVVHAIVLDSTSSAYFDDVAATGEYKELQSKMKELVDNVRSVITRFSNPYIKDFLDYYTMMFTLKFKDVIACILKDRGLYTGSSAQFCALNLE